MKIEKKPAKPDQPRRTGRPPSRKKLLTLRLEPDVVEFYKATGPGWLQRVNDTLKRSMMAKLKAKQARRE